MYVSIMCSRCAGTLGHTHAFSVSSLPQKICAFGAKGPIFIVLLDSQITVKTSHLLSDSEFTYCTGFHTKRRFTLWLMARGGLNPSGGAWLVSTRTLCHQCLQKWFPSPALNLNNLKQKLSYQGRFGGGVRWVFICRIIILQQVAGVSEEEM